MFEMDSRSPGKRYGLPRDMDEVSVCGLSWLHLHSPLVTSYLSGVIHQARRISAMEM